MNSVNSLFIVDLWESAATPLIFADLAAQQQSQLHSFVLKLLAVLTYYIQLQSVYCVINVCKEIEKGEPV